MQKHSLVQENSYFQRTTTTDEKKVFRDHFLNSNGVETREFVEGI